jgi:hypothetical protein
MAVNDTDIEARIVAYIRSTLSANDFPNRHNAIRDVTGQIDVLPSGVAKVITKMIEAGSLRHLKSNDRLELIERAPTASADPDPAEPSASPAAKGGKGKPKKA